MFFFAAPGLCIINQGKFRVNDGSQAKVAVDSVDNSDLDQFWCSPAASEVNYHFFCFLQGYFCRARSLTPKDISVDQSVYLCAR